MRYCIRKEKLKKLLTSKYADKVLSDVIFNPDSTLSTEEKIKISVDKLSKSTVFQELYFAPLLSDFYFGPNVNTNICFDMKSEFNPKVFEKESLSISALNKWIESDSPTDCYILKNSDEFAFQIKTYPEKYGKSLATKDFVKYIKNLSEEKYGDMSDIILVLIPQVKKPGSILPTNLKKLKSNLEKQEPKFKEVIILLNVEGKDSLFRAYKKQT